MKKLRKVLIWLATAILIVSGIYLVLPYYLKQAVINLTPNIDDYKIFANSIVLSGNEIPWKRASDFNAYELSAAQEALQQKYGTVAFLVAQNQQLVYENFWQGYNQNSYSNSFSMAKTIVSLLVGIANDKGYIKSLDDPVGQYLSEFNTPQNKGLTIRHLLTMSSGLNWDEAYASPFSKTTQAYYGNDLRKLHLGLKVIEKPGEKFIYYSANTQLLAFIVQAATGQSLARFASENLWEPLGASKDALWSMDNIDGDVKAYCCFNSNVEDFARLGQLVLNKGTFNGKEIISESYLKQMCMPDSYLVDEDDQNVNYYGLHIWIVNYKNLKIPYFRGILGQYIFIIPQKNAVVVRLGERRDKKYKNHHPLDVYAYLDMALELLNKR